MADWQSAESETVTLPQDLLQLVSGANKLALDPAVGNLRLLEFGYQGNTLGPLHSAPWLDEQNVAMPSDTPPVVRYLAGDFFCAPFGASDVEEAPPHGHTANSSWSVLNSSSGTARLRADREVMGAQVEKELVLAAEAPLLLQRHHISGGSGGLTCAHHPMVSLASSGQLCCSTKLIALTGSTPLDQGRNFLAAASNSADLRSFPTAAGGRVDLLQLPIATSHEDFVTLVEQPGNEIGWTAIVRHTEQDIVFFVKRPTQLPLTMLWHSNAGRDYAPWNGRHCGVVGIEDGCAEGSNGHQAALVANDITKLGVPSCFELAADKTHVIEHLTGCVKLPVGWQQIVEISLVTGTLTLQEASGAELELPVAPDWLQGA